MELWQMDVVGRIFLIDGTELHAVTAVDDHSWFCVSASSSCGRRRWLCVSQDMREVITIEVTPADRERLELIIQVALPAKHFPARIVLFERRCRRHQAIALGDTSRSPRSGLPAREAATKRSASAT